MKNAADVNSKVQPTESLVDLEDDALPIAMDGSDIDRTKEENLAKLKLQSKELL